MARAIGLILTITGAVISIWFGQLLLAPEPAPAASFAAGAIGLAMVSVGIRYLIKGANRKS
jgi:hypothetical protein